MNKEKIQNEKDNKTNQIEIDYKIPLMTEIEINALLNTLKRKK